ncbi:MAG: hypothetical protein A3K65_03410 [Euryarchaeota archaeon RBG_16_68_12]|nr:MAG: hypothetical protein A3K65_03410 [Euryarchaeota archaeon RBG_16_68_12]
MDYWGYRNGTLAWGAEQSDVAALTFLEPGTWNLSFETTGAFAVAYYLPELCGWTISSSDLAGVSCPILTVSEATAFALNTWSLDRPYVLRVSGGMQSSFFDEFLQPLGNATEMRYDSRMMGLVVVVPTSGTASVTFTIAAVATQLDLTTYLLAGLVLAVLVVVIVITAVIVRERRAHGSPRAVARSGSAVRRLRNRRGKARDRV